MSAKCIKRFESTVMKTTALSTEIIGRIKEASFSPTTVTRYAVAAILNQGVANCTAHREEEIKNRVEEVHGEDLVFDGN